MGPEFFQTVMGRQFFEGTVPRIARALERIAKALEQEPKEAARVVTTDFNTKVQQRSAAMMTGAPLEIGDLILRNGFPHSDTVTITSVGGHTVMVTKDRDGTFVDVDGILSFKLGESFTGDNSTES